MKKNELLNTIKDLASQNLLSENELLDAFNEGKSSEYLQSSPVKLTIPNVLYFTGAGIIFIGISVLIGQNWSALNIFTKLLSTLGAGIASYYIGILFSKSAKLDPIGQAFFCLSALIIPTGIYILFDHAGLNLASRWVQSIIPLTLLGMYLGTYLLFKKDLLLTFSIIFGTWLFFSATNALLGSHVYSVNIKFFEYRILLIGLSYMSLGYYFSLIGKSTLSRILNGLGAIGFLGAAFALGGWSPKQSVFWEIIFPGLVYGIIVLSVYLRNKSFLIIGSFYLMIYLVKLTAEYFSKGLGWPFALVLAGLSVIVIGYYTYYLDRKYIKPTI